MKSPNYLLAASVCILVITLAPHATAQQGVTKPGSSLLLKPFVNDAANAFVKSDGGYVHWLTSVKCPTNVGGIPLGDIRQFNIQGHSVKCRYTDNRSVRTDFFIRTFDASDDIEKIIARISQNIERDEPVLRKYPAQRVEMDFGGQKIKCIQSSFDFKPSKSGTRISESFAACNMKNWLLQISERGLTAQKAKNAQVTKAFLNLQSGASSHLASCIAEAAKRREMQPSKATGLNIAVDRFGYAEKGVPCFSGNISSKEGRDPLLLLYWPENSDTPSTIHSVSSTGTVNRQPIFQLQDMWATVAAAERGEGGYLLVKKDPDGTVSSYGGFLRIIGSGRLFGEYEKVRKGELKPRTVSKPAASGGKNITIG